MATLSWKTMWEQPDKLALPASRLGPLSALLAINLLIIAYGAQVDGDVFDELHFGTFFSAFQMFMGGLMARALYQLRGSRLWRLLSLGLFFLAADDLLGLHEGIDSLFHLIMRMEPTHITDRIDDAIVGLYLAAGSVTIIRYRREFFRAPSVRLLLGLAFAGGLISVVFDALTNQYDVLPDLFGDNSATRHLQVLLKVAEDVGKLLATYFFIICLSLHLRHGCYGDTLPWDDDRHKTVASA